MLNLIRVFGFFLAFSCAALAQTHEQPDLEQQGDGEPYTAQHPLDALTPEEIALGTSLLRDQGLASDSTRFPVFTLKEPAKSEVLAWKAGDPLHRVAHIVTWDSGVATEIDIDLTNRAVVTSKALPSVQPSIMDAEWAKARDKFIADPRYKAAIARRGLDKGHKVFCTPNSAGYYPSEAFKDRRILRIPCFDDVEKLHPSLARPIEGLMGVVDSTSGEVIDVIDREVVDLPPAPRGYGKTAPTAFPPLRSIDIVNDNGSNITLSNNLEVGWFRWKFHVRADRRAGLVLSLAKFDDGQAERLAVYQMYLSEIFVPYMDPNPTWSYRTFLDAGEFGLGYLSSSLRAGVDCPETAVMVDLTFPNDVGGSYMRPRALCIFERPTGDPAWRHYSSGNKTVNGRAETELVVRHIPTLGNYDYIVDYVFTQRGNINVRLGATGFDAVKSVASADMNSPTIKTDTEYGALIAPYTVAPYHDHYYSFRIDLDVDGPVNQVNMDSFIPDTIANSTTRRSLWRLGTTCMETEGPLDHSGRGYGGDVIRVVNSKAVTPRLKYNPSYWISYDHAVTSLLDPDDPPQLRAAFSGKTLWVTKYKPNELWASGDFPNLSHGGDGLPAFVADKESIKDQDVVLWYTMAFRHPTRPEDFPILPTYWHEFSLRPFRFFDYDPSSLLSEDPATDAEQQQ